MTRRSRPDTDTDTDEGAGHEPAPPPARMIAPGIESDAAYDDQIHEATTRLLEHLARHDDARNDARRNGSAPPEPLDPFHDIAHPTRRAFLRALSCCGNVARAARAAGISRFTPYSQPWRDDEAYQAALPVARALGAELLELEAQRRAVEGVLTPVGFYKGVPGAWVRQYSDALLLALLKANSPEKFGDKLSVRGAFTNIDWESLPDEAVARMARGEHPAAVLASLAPRALPPGDAP